MGSRGVGADLAAYPRIYNPLKQTRRFDPAETYVRRWLPLPELAGFRDAAILDPVVARDGRPGQLELLVSDARAYLAPVVDHEAAARAFLEPYAREVRRSRT